MVSDSEIEKIVLVLKNAKINLILANNNISVFYNFNDLKFFNELNNVVNKVKIIEDEIEADIKWFNDTCIEYNQAENANDILLEVLTDRIESVISSNTVVSGTIEKESEQETKIVFESNNVSLYTKKRIISNCVGRIASPDSGTKSWKSLWTSTMNRINSVAKRTDTIRKPTKTTTKKTTSPKTTNTSFSSLLGLNFINDFVSKVNTFCNSLKNTTKKFTSIVEKFCETINYVKENGYIRLNNEKFLYVYDNKLSITNTDLSFLTYIDNKFYYIITADGKVPQNVKEILQKGGKIGLEVRPFVEYNNEWFFVNKLCVGGVPAYDINDSNDYYIIKDKVYGNLYFDKNGNQLIWVSNGKFDRVTYDDVPGAKYDGYFTVLPDMDLMLNNIAFNILKKPAKALTANEYIEQFIAGVNPFYIYDFIKVVEEKEEKYKESVYYKENLKKASLYKEDGLLEKYTNLIGDKIGSKISEFFGGKMIVSIGAAVEEVLKEFREGNDFSESQGNMYIVLSTLLNYEKNKITEDMGMIGTNLVEGVHSILETELKYEMGIKDKAEAKEELDNLGETQIKNILKKVPGEIIKTGIDPVDDFINAASDKIIDVGAELVENAYSAVKDMG